MRSHGNGEEPDWRYRKAGGVPTSTWLHSIVCTLWSRAETEQGDWRAADESGEGLTKGSGTKPDFLITQPHSPEHSEMDGEKWKFKWATLLRQDTQVGESGIQLLRDVITDDCGQLRYLVWLHAPSSKLTWAQQEHHWPRPPKTTRTPETAEWDDTRLGRSLGCRWWALRDLCYFKAEMLCATFSRLSNSAFIWHNIKWSFVFRGKIIMLLLDGFT